MILSDILELEQRIQAERENIRELERSSINIDRMLMVRRTHLAQLEQTHEEALADLREHTPTRGIPLLTGELKPDA